MPGKQGQAARGKAARAAAATVRAVAERKAAAARPAATGPMGRAAHKSGSESLETDGRSGAFPSGSVKEGEHAPGPSGIPGGPGLGPAGLPERAGAEDVKKPPTADPLAEGPRRTGRPKGVKDSAPRISKEEREKLKSEDDRKARKLVIENRAKEWVTPEIVAMLREPFEVVAEKRGDHWKLTETQAERICMAGARVVAKYLPEDWLDRFGEEVGLGIVLFVTFWPKVKTERRLIAERKLKTVPAETETE